MPRDDDDDRPRKRRVRDDADEDRPRSRKARRDEDDDYDDRPRKRKNTKKPPQQSVLGGVALSTGILGLVMSIACGAIGLAPAVAGLGLGIIAFVIAQKSEGRQSPILPLAGSVVSLVATGVSIFFLVSFLRAAREVRDGIKEGIEQYEKEGAQWNQEQDQATADVRAAGAGGVIKMTAQQFYQAMRNDDGRFDRLYDNKVIELTGQFDGSNLVVEPYVVLLRGGGPGDTVNCHFAQNAGVRARLTRLKEGDAITIRGKYMGRGLWLEGCVLMSGA